VGRFRSSYSVSGCSAEEVSGAIDRRARLGYDAVELGGELPLLAAEHSNSLTLPSNRSKQESM
jgi:hypothetical protein